MEASQDVKRLYELLDRPVKVVISFLTQPEIIIQPSILPYRVMLARMLQFNSIDDKAGYLEREQVVTARSVQNSPRADYTVTTNEDAILVEEEEPDYLNGDDMKLMNEDSLLNDL